MSFSVNDKHGYNYGREASDILDLCDEIEVEFCNKHEYNNDEHECDNDEHECDNDEHECDNDKHECDNDKHECEHDNWERHECPKPCPKPIPKKGKISVTVKLNCSDGEPLECVKVNLYRLCGCSPELVASKFTNSCGKVEFKCLDNGNYRVIEIIDKCFFEKPEYFPWNEVCIDDRNKFSEILIINKLRKIEKPCCPPPISNNCCGGFDGCCGGCDRDCGRFDRCCDRDCGRFDRCCDRDCGRFDRCCDRGCGRFDGCCDNDCGGFGGGCGSLIILFLLFGICW